MATILLWPLLEPKPLKRSALIKAINLILLAAVGFVSLANAQEKKAEFKGIVVIRGQIQGVEVQKLGTHSFRNGLVNGEMIASSSNINQQEAAATTERGFAVGNNLAKYKTEFSDCKDAVITVAADEGNFFPNKNGHEIYRVPPVLGFTCLD